MVARGEDLKATTDRLCLEVELLCPAVACSVLSVDRGGIIHPLSAPSLPESYSRSLDGLAIGPNAGSCGSAAYLRRPVAVTDIASDPRWVSFRETVLGLGFKACWSSPISNGRGDVLGTFAFYYREQRGPTEAEQEIVATCVHLCAIALERHERVTERERLANVDMLTGLANRASFNRALAALSCSEPGAWALLVADLDNLKVVNDTFGHHTGDLLLQVIAARIAAVAAPDTVFRLGGDEYAIIVQHQDSLRDLDTAAKAILDAIEEPAQCGAQLINPKVTLGGAIVSPNDHVAESVRQNADFALYHAKETGRGGFVRYWPGIGTAITERLSAIRMVSAALSQDRLAAYYQPVVRLDTRQIVAVEALCRIIADDGRVVPAADFFEATTDAHAATGITAKMLKRVVSDIRHWLDLGIPVGHVGINVSSSDFHKGRLDELLTDAFRRENVPLDHLLLEVTEDVAVGQRDQAVARQIKAMRSKGLRVALDDFGTGFASLTHLLTFPVDIIKIDKSFIRSLAFDNPSGAIVKGLIDIAQKMDIEVLAEGIETEAQAQLLRGFGCRLGQGYLFSRAVDRDRMTELFGQQSIHGHQATA